MPTAMPTALPSLFVSHGSPTLVLDPVPTRDFLRGLGQAMPRPRAILCVSAHWDTAKPLLSANPHPHTMHDFYGFPDELYEQSYPAPGAPELAARARALLHDAQIPAELDKQRGIDHGAWVPLSLMHPLADIPLAQLSIQSHLPPRHHLELGQALAPLRQEGVLIIASGNATHNLREVFSHGMTEAPAPYAKAFADWLSASIVAGGAGDTEALLDYLRQGPSGPRNHPTPDHYLPLLVALGAGLGANDGGNGAGTLLHDGYTYGVLSMAAYAWN